jgi:single-strand DNA-binding protein
MKSLNQMQSIGNLGKAPEMHFTPSGRQVTTGSIAMNRQWSNADGTKSEKTEWLNWEAWGKAAEIINQYATKGSKMFLQGRIETNRVEGRDGGADKYFTKLVVTEFMFLSGSNAGERGEAGEPDESVAVIPVEDDIPF